MNIIMPGLEGKQSMARMLDRLRGDPQAGTSPPKSIAGMAVTHFEDLRDPNGRMGPIKGATDAAGRNVLIFQLGDSAKVVLRPSGTEPKAKAYIEVCSPPRAHGQSDSDWETSCRAVDAQTQQLADEFLRLAMSMAGLEPPSGHVQLSR
jgi:phosphoglucomutase/phosphomannomutase